MKRSEIVFGLLRIPVDFLMGALGFILAFSLRAQTDLIPGVQLAITLPTWTEFLLFVGASGIGLVLLFALNGMYSLKNTFRVQEEMWKVLYTSLLWVACIVGYFFLIRTFFFSRLVLIYGWLFSVIFLMMGRVIVRAIQKALVKKGIGSHKVVMVGYTKTSQHLAAAFDKTKLYHIQGYLDDEPSHVPKEETYLGALNKLEEVLADNSIDEVIQTARSIDRTTTEELVNICHQYHVKFRYVPDDLEVHRLNITVRDEAGIPVMEIKASPLDGWGRVWKRALDIFGASVGIILLSPFWVSTALAVWIQMKSFRQILFFNKRYGQHGKVFTCLKFQSMYVGAEAEHAKLMAEQEGERDGLLKITNDPRVTPVGRFIRKTSLDELPQFWNVLKGEMSLVGPRPHMPAEVDKVKKYYSPILHMKPGISGLPQVSGRASLSFKEEMRLDLYYMENWSLLMDIIIIIKTFGVIFSRKGVEGEKQE